MTTTITPFDSNLYRLVDNFKSAGTVDDHTSPFPDSTVWTTMDGDGLTLFPCNANAYVTAHASTSGGLDWVASNIISPVERRYRILIDLGAINVSMSIFFRVEEVSLSTRTPIQTQAGFNGYKFRIKENGGAGTTLVKLSKITAGVATEVNDTDGNSEAVIDSIDPSSKLIVSMEDTGLQFIVKISDTTRAWDLDGFSSNQYFGFNCSAATALLREFRVW